MNLNNNRSFFFDIDTLVDINSHAWIVDKDYPNEPILRISRSEFNLIKNGIFKSCNNKIKFNDIEYYISNDMYNSIKYIISKSKEKRNISNLAISLFEFLNPDYVVDNVDYKFNDELKNIVKNIQDIDDVYIICSYKSKRSYSKIIEKLLEKLLEFGIKPIDVYYISETFYNYKSDDVVYNKIKLIIQHAVGYKSKDGVFINTEINKYNDIYFYDDVDYIVYKDHFNRIFNELIYNTESYIKDDIIYYVKSSVPKINICKLTSNKYNTIDMKTTYLKYQNVVRFFENFKR